MLEILMSIKINIGEVMENGYDWNFTSNNLV
jgi:hypothetical protein